MSLTSYRAAPPRVGGWFVSSSETGFGFRAVLPEVLPEFFPSGFPWGFSLGFVLGGWKTWRRPTLPRLEAQYHGRWGISRPSSGWDRVQAPRHGHQVVQPPRVEVRSVADPPLRRTMVLAACRAAALPLGRLSSRAAWIAAAHDASASGLIPRRFRIEPVGRLGPVS